MKRRTIHTVSLVTLCLVASLFAGLPRARAYPKYPASETLLPDGWVDDDFDFSTYGATPWINSNDSDASHIYTSTADEHNAKYFTFENCSTYWYNITSINLYCRWKTTGIVLYAYEVFYSWEHNTTSWKATGTWGFVGTDWETSHIDGTTKIEDECPSYEYVVNGTCPFADNYRLWIWQNPTSNEKFYATYVELVVNGYRTLAPPEPPLPSWIDVYFSFGIGMAGIVLMCASPTWFVMKAKSKGAHEDTIERGVYAILIFCFGYGLFIAWLSSS